MTDHVLIRDSKSQEFTFKRFITLPIIILGLCAWISYILIGATSKEEFRNNFYEIFLFSHVFFQFTAMTFLYFHHYNARPYILAAVTIFIIDRFLLRLYVRTLRTSGEMTILPDGKTVRISLTLPEDCKLEWRAGEHAFLSIPRVAVLHPHPFSIASPSPSLQQEKDKTMEFLIRARDGFSKKLLAYASTTVVIDAVVDGPYGSSFTWECMSEADVTMFVAGGSGITVVYPLVHQIALLREKNSPRSDEEAGALGRQQRIVLVWVVHSEQHLAWLRDGVLKGLTKAGVDVLVHVSQREGGRPNIYAVMDNVASDLEKRKLGIVVCGPNSMVRDTRNAGARLMREGYNVRVVAEKFGW
jgi:predicted ferric reductase